MAGHIVGLTDITDPDTEVPILVTSAGKLRCVVA